MGPRGKPHAVGSGAEEARSRRPLSVFVLTLNEADRLRRTLRSVAWADERIVVDCGSTDGTPEVARAEGARVVHHPWEGYSRQKEFSLSLCREDWVLWIDADEEISDPLKKSIEAALRREDPPDGFEMARRTIYLGKPLRFGGWYPDWKVRLFRKDRVRFDGLRVHESARVEGTVGRLEGDLLHYSFRSLSHHMEKVDAYATLWASERRGAARARFADLLLHPPAKFAKSYILRLGFLEGWRGLVVASMGALYVALKYAKLKEVERPMTGSETPTPAGEAARPSPAPEAKPRAETPSSKEEISIDDFGRLDLRIGLVRSCRPHPDAYRLLLLDVDLGPEGQRQIVAGIASAYVPENLVGRRIAVVVNLKPAKLRGEVSQGMLLAASDGSAISLLGPDQDVAPGSRIR